MLRSLIKLALILVAGILVYNYFFGTPEEKAQSKEIFSDVKSLTQSAIGLIKSEKEKFDEGKYDDAVDKVGGLIDDLKGKAQYLEDNKGLLGQLSELESKQEALEAKISRSQVQSYGNSGEQVEMDSAELKEIREDWASLLAETERIMQEMEQKAEKEQ